MNLYVRIFVSRKKKFKDIWHVVRYIMTWYKIETQLDSKDVWHQKLKKGRRIFDTKLECN